MMIPFVYKSLLQHLMRTPGSTPTFPLKLMLYDFMTFMTVPFLLWFDSPPPLPPFLYRRRTNFSSYGHTLSSLTGGFPLSALSLPF